MKRKVFYLLKIFFVALIMALISYYLIGLGKRDSTIIFIIALTAHPIVNYIYKIE